MTRPLTITAQGNAQISTAQSKFGGSSALLDGTGDYLNIDSTTELAFGTGDFCMEAWIYKTGGTSYHTIFDMRTNGSDGGGIILGINNVNQIYMYYNFGYRVTTAAITENTWTHIALARVSGETRVFINGTQSGSTYTDTNNYAQRGLHIGADPLGNYAFPGYMDDIRISKGSGRYSSTFTPSTFPLTNDAYTSLLINANGTNASTVFVDNVYEQTDSDLLYIEDSYFDLDSYYVYTASAASSQTSESSVSCDAEIVAGAVVEATGSFNSENSTSITVGVIRQGASALSSEFTQTATISHIHGADLFAFSDAQLAAQVDVIRDYNLAASSIFSTAIDAVRGIYVSAQADSQVDLTASVARSRASEAAVNAAFSLTVDGVKEIGAVANLQSSVSLSASAIFVVDITQALSSSFTQSATLTRISRNIGTYTLVQGGNRGGLGISSERSKFGGSSLKFNARNGSYSLLTGFQWNGSQFVALAMNRDFNWGSDTNQPVYTVTSNDGITFTASANDIPLVINAFFEPQDLYYLNGQFVAVVPTTDPSDGKIYSSSNASTWTEKSSYTNKLFYSFVYNNSRYIRCGSNSVLRAAIEYSSDLITWTSTTGANDVGGVGNSASFNAMATKGTTTVAVGDIYDPTPGVNYNMIYSSTNATTWTQRRNTAGPDLNDVAASSSIFVAVGDEGLILTSSDGTTWTQQTSGVSVNLSNISFVNNLFVVVGGSNTILTSSDGTTWTQQTLVGSLPSVGSSTNYLKPAYGNSRYIITGLRDLVSSTDATTWTASTDYDFDIPNQRQFLTYPDYDGWTTWKTIDFWIYVETYDPEIIGEVFRISQGSNSNWSVAFRPQNGTNVRFSTNINGTLTYAPSPYANFDQWIHVRLVNNGTTYSLYADGARVITFNSTALSNDSGPLEIETDTYAIPNMWIDELLVTDEMLNDPSLTTITVPTSEYTNTLDTSLLLHFNSSLDDDNTAPPRQQSGEASLSNTASTSITANSQFDSQASLSSTATVYALGQAQVGSDVTLFDSISLTAAVNVITDTSITADADSNLTADNNVIKDVEASVESNSSIVGSISLTKQAVGAFESIASQLSVIRITTSNDVYLDSSFAVSVTAAKTTDINCQADSSSALSSPANYIPNFAVTDLSSSFSIYADADSFITIESTDAMVFDLSAEITKTGSLTADLTSNFALTAAGINSAQINVSLFNNANLTAGVVKTVDITSTNSLDCQLSAETTNSVTRTTGADLTSEFTDSFTSVKIVDVEIDTDSIATELVVAAKDVVAWVLCEALTSVNVTAVKTAGATLNATVESSMSAAAVKTARPQSVVQSQATVYAAGYTASDATAFLTANGGVLTAAVKQATGIVTDTVVATLSLTPSVTRTTSSQQSVVSLMPPFVVGKISGFASTMSTTSSFYANAGVRLNGVAYISSAMVFAAGVRELRLDEIVYVIPAEIWSYEIVSESRNYKIKSESRIHVITK